MGRSLAVNQGEFVLYKNVTLDGLETSPLTIDAAGSGPVFRVPEEGIVVTMEGLRITGGAGYGGGGGIHNSGTLTIQHCEIERNTAVDGRGGGVYNAQGILTVIDSTFSLNSAEGGGGIFNYGGTVSVTGSRFIANSTTGFGGALANEGGNATVTTTTISGNSTQSNGGGLYNGYMGTLTVTRSTLSGNEAYSNGGGVFSQAATVRVVSSTLSGNSASEGGGIYVTNGQTIEVTNSTLTGNLAQYRGGGLATSYSPAQTTVNNTIIAGNLGGYAPDIYFPSGQKALSGSNNLIGDTSGQSSLVDGVNGNLVGTAADPIDPVLGPLTDNGGPTLTHSLLDGSPAIDAGSDTLVVGLSDQRGRARIFGTVDIGAVEIQPDGIAQAVSDGFDVTVDVSVTFDPRSNDLVPEGYTAAVQVLSDVAHGELTTNPDGTFTYVPDDGFIGEDSFRYRLDTGIGILSQEAIVVFNVIPAGCLLVDAVDDVLDGDVSEGHLCLREAISLATQGETVYISASLVDQTIALQTGELVLYRDIVIHGLQSNPVTIDAGEQGRAFRVTPAADATIEGVRLTGGYANGPGGAILNYGTLTIQHSTIEGNVAQAGGGIFNQNGTLVVLNSVIDGNHTDGSYGGGVYSQGGTVFVVNSTLSRNWAYNNGGGIFSSGGALTVTNSVLVGNATFYAGGGIYNANADLAVTNSTIAGNSARNLGGGIYSTDGSRQTTLYNSILAGNVASSAPDILVKLVTLSASHTLIANGEGQSALIDGQDGNLIGTAEAPKDPGFVRDPSDGGDGFGDNPQTSGLDESLNDDYGDLRLREDSLAVDAGDDSLLPEDAYDLDGDTDMAEPIPYDLDEEPRVWGERVDIGAYEYAVVAAVSGDLNGDGAVGSADLDIVRANWGRSVTPGSLLDGDPSGDGTVGSADLDIIRANWGQTAAAAAAAAMPQAERQNASYGPARDPGKTAPREHDALFANPSTFAEAAWQEAIESLRTRREKRPTAAVDAVMLGMRDEDEG